MLLRRIEKRAIYLLSGLALLTTIVACGDDLASLPDASPPDIDEPTPGACPSDWVRPFNVDARDYPFTSRCAALEHGLIHYFDEIPEGQPVRGTVLAVHGNPTWSFLYRKMAAQLLERGFRFIALDLYGFGMSDKPSIDEFDYQASSHAEIVNRFVESIGLSDFILVLQDWGGPVGLGMAVRQPDRVQGIVLINTWSWEVERITSGAASYMHTIHDWGVESLVNAPYYDSSMQTAHRAGRGLGARNDPTFGSTFERIRNAFRGPFFSLDAPYEALSPDVIQPVNIFARALITDRIFLRDLDRAMPVLYDKPAYFLFGDDTAFGPVKCDVGPWFSYDFDEPRVSWTDDRIQCPASYVCETDEPEPLKHNCVDENGDPYWAILDRYLQRWQPNALVGAWNDPSAGHWLQETHPEEAATAVIAIADHIERGH